MQFSEKTKAWLLYEARRAIEHYLDTRSVFVPSFERIPEEIQDELTTQSGIFVIISKKDKQTKESSIRGMMGTIHASDEVWKLVGQFAVNAAFFDFRTPRLKPYELNEIRIQLCFPEFVENGVTSEELTDMLEENQYGLLATYNNRESYLLPHAWQDILEAEQFIRILLLQLGVRPNMMWDKSIEYKPFRVIEVVEE